MNPDQPIIQQSTPTEPSSPPAQPQFQPKPVKHKKSKAPLVVLLVILLLGAAAYGGYWYRGQSAKKQLNTKIAEIAQLQKDKDDLNKQLTETKTKTTTTTTTTATTGPTAATLTSVKAAITSGNTAALAGFMNAKVTVVTAGADALPAQTSAQAVTAITAGIKGATAPWDFALPATTLNTYGASTYAQYFPDGALVGKSANKYVISFTFNTAGKITTVFMTSNADQLQ